MGRTAHAFSSTRPNTPFGMTEHQALLDQIGSLIGGGDRDATVVERTLTDGYAQALSLEAERWRIQKRLGSVAATLDVGDTAGKAKELSELARRLESQNVTLLHLRGLLTQLRSEYAEMTAPPPAAARKR
jgi:hypothetical protein